MAIQGLSTWYIEGTSPKLYRVRFTENGEEKCLPGTYKFEELIDLLDTYDRTGTFMRQQAYYRFRGQRVRVNVKEIPVSITVYHVSPVDPADGEWNIEVSKDDIEYEEEQIKWT